MKIGRINELTINPTTAPITSSMTGSARRASNASCFSSSRSYNVG